HRTGGPRLLSAESGVRMAERGEIPVLGRLLFIPRPAGAAGAIGGGAGAVLERGGRGGTDRSARGVFGVATARDRSSGRDSGGRPGAGPGELLHAGRVCAAVSGGGGVRRRCGSPLKRRPPVRSLRRPRVPLGTGA